MLTTCVRCLGFVPDDCGSCPNCGAHVVEVADQAAALERADVAGSAGQTPGPGVRFLRLAFKGALITGSSMVLAACYGCPPAGCGSLDDGAGSGASGNVNTGGGPASGGAFGTGASGPTGGSAATGGGAPTGGNATAGEGGMGGFGGDLEGGAP